MAGRKRIYFSEAAGEPITTVDTANWGRIMCFQLLSPGSSHLRLNLHQEILLLLSDQT